MEQHELLSQLPASVHDSFLDITDYRVLGASKHIHLIGCILSGTASEFERAGRSFAEFKALAGQTGQFFQETRGDASRAVYNAVGELLQGIHALPVMERYAAAVQTLVQQYDAHCRKNQCLIAEYAAQLSSDTQQILVYDYSSTVAMFLRQLGTREQKPQILIPESRVINGGAEFVLTAQESGLPVHYIPDAALLYYLPGCSAAFIGAETFFPDGTAFNTTGSDLAALACESLSIPFYVLTPLNKVDFRAVFGHRKRAVMRNLQDTLFPCLKKNTDPALVDFSCPELLPIPAGQITAYITEKGILPIPALFAAAKEYADSLEVRNETMEP